MFRRHVHAAPPPETSDKHAVELESCPVLAEPTQTFNIIDAPAIVAAAQVDAEIAETYVSAVVPDTDEVDMPTFTFRVAVLGTLWCIILATANTIFSFRTVPVAIPGFLATLLSYPMGIFMAHALPPGKILNPGPFTVKEHVLITVIAGAGGVAYGVDNVVAQKAEALMGNTSITLFESMCWVLTTQLIGYGLAGVSRRFLVYPPAMLWPNTLSTVALFVGFHGDHRDDATAKWKMSRYKFFWIVFVGVFVYTWIPEYFMVVLQSFSILCFFGGNKTLRFLASADNGEGVGLGALTLDWYYVGGAMLTLPWWAIVNNMASNLFWAWVVTPTLYYTNALGINNLTLGRTFSDGTPVPVLNSVALFGHNGTRLKAVQLYNHTTFDLDERKYHESAPIYITPMFAMLYAGSFMAIAASFSHVILWYGKDIKDHFLAALRQQRYTASESAQTTPDIHTKLMSAYRDIPEKFFLIFLVVLLLFQILVCTFTPFVMPIWAVLLAIAISASAVLPVGVIKAVSGTGITLNVLMEFVAGLLMPGKTVAVMAFKSLGFNAHAQALGLLADLKLGHYMHIAPYAMMGAQLWGTIVGAIVNVLASFWALDRLGSSLGKGDWQMITYQMFYNAGAIWGAIGPARFFGPSSPYNSLLWCFL
ncbi:hypothetical protein HK104_000836, partial [Borealophlyctis nickersoniae]